MIPCLLLKGTGFVKTVRFDRPTYLGDPVNILKIFNDKEVDEVMVLDIDATPSGRGPNWPLLQDFASECFMPLGYGGGLRSLDQMERVLQMGFEKVCLNTAAHDQPDLIEQAARAFGSQSVVVSMDVKKSRVVTRGGTQKTKSDPASFARDVERRGAGEILVNSVDRDGTMEGYDLDLLRMVTQAVHIPVVACGGAGSVDDLAAAVREAGVSAVAAGSLFVFQGRHRAVLINVPPAAELEARLP